MLTRIFITILNNLIKKGAYLLEFCYDLSL